MATSMVHPGTTIISLGICILLTPGPPGLVLGFT